MQRKIKILFYNKFFLGSLLITFIYIFLLNTKKIYPFGNNTILLGDLNAQYIHFFCYLKNIILGTKGLFMSWNLGMGCHFYSNFFWQLSNPLNIFVIFFDNLNMHISISIILFIKLLLIFNCFMLFLHKVFNSRSHATIIFSLCYTFSSFFIKNYFNIMWLDVLYILPLSVIFIEKYIKDDKLYPVIISYVYMLFIQYYMAYSMIIFCSIYYVALFWLHNKIEKNNLKPFILKTIPLAFGTILSVGTAMIIFVPTLNILHEITNINNQFIYLDNLTIFNIINSLTIDYHSNICEKIGFYYCGSIIFILFVLFFINKQISLKEKLIYIGLILILLLPVTSPIIYRFWHGGTATHGYNFRYFYLVTFVFVTIGAKAYLKLKISMALIFVSSNE